MFLYFHNLCFERERLKYNFFWDNISLCSDTWSGDCKDIRVARQMPFLVATDTDMGFL